MPKNLGLYDNDLSVPRKKDIDDLADVVDGKYSASNPPPYPVTSVNGQTGSVTIDVNVPDNLVSYSDLVNVEATPAIDADTLSGHNAGYFATSAQMTSVSGDVNTLKTQMTTANQNITNINNSKVDKTGGTMMGALVAQNNVNYTTKQVRNIIISTGDPTGGSNGDIWIRYAP